jgi:outer membrane protein assembly factor BamB
MSVMRMTVLMCLAVTFAVAPSPVRAQSATTGLSLPAEPMLNRRGLTRRWWGHAVMDSQRDKLLYLSVDEGFLFMQSSAGVVTAFDCETGKQLWARSIGVSDRTIYPATLNDEMLIVINGLQMYGVRKTTGDILWELKLPRQPSASAVADEDRVYIGFQDGSMSAFDLKTIRELFSSGMLPQFANQTVKWRYRTSRPITVPALPDGNLVAFASGNGSVYSVHAEDRKLSFQFETDAALSAPMIRYRDQLLLASEDAHFYSLKAINGHPAWEFATGDVIRKAPILIDDEVYLLPDQGRLFKLSAATGKELWARPKPRTRSFLSASARHVFIAGNDNALKILSRVSGETVGEFPLDRFTVHLTNDRNDRIYVATESGVLMCLHELGRDFPRFHLHPDRAPVLPDLAPDSFDPDAEPAAETSTEEAKPEEAQ